MTDCCGPIVFRSHVPLTWDISKAQVMRPIPHSPLGKRQTPSRYISMAGHLVPVHYAAVRPVNGVFPADKYLDLNRLRMCYAVA
jgi:hypothetical protein